MVLLENTRERGMKWLLIALFSIVCCLFVQVCVLYDWNVTFLLSVLMPASGLLSSLINIR